MKTNHVNHSAYLVALPTAQGVRNPMREHSGYAPNGIFVTRTSDAIRYQNLQRWQAEKRRREQRLINGRFNAVLPDSVANALIAEVRGGR